MVTIRGVDRATEVICLLGGLVTGMAEEWLGGADMLGISDCQFGCDDLSEQMRVNRSAKLPCGNSGYIRPQIGG